MQVCASLAAAPPAPDSTLLQAAIGDGFQFYTGHGAHQPTPNDADFTRDTPRVKYTRTGTCDETVTSHSAIYFSAREREMVGVREGESARE